ncbi:MAG: DUF4405 domain-containing protein [Clostridiales bacterium]|nr:DUF4405 domain-containing protein [Clostridiales bacterium]
MKNKNWVKIALDVFMAIFLALLYNTHAISISFHELGGLFICFLFLIHQVLNLDWISSVTKRLFKKTIPFKTRVQYVLDCLLFITYTLILISGVMISKTIFAGFFVSSPIWKTVHYTSAAFALIFTGIHVGLHWSFITGMLKKLVRVPHTLSKPIGIVFAVAVLLFGLYSIKESDFTRWIAMPFTSSGIQQSFPDRNQTDFHSGTNGNPDKSKLTINNLGEKGGDRNRNIGNEKTILETIATSLSIIGFFALFTYLPLSVLGKKKRSLLE